MLPEGYDKAVRIVRGEIDAETRAGFPQVRRVPSAHMVSWLDYCCDDLDAARRDALIDAKAQFAACLFFPAAMMHISDLMSHNPALVAQGNAMNSGRFTLGLRYYALSDTKAFLTNPATLARIAQPGAA